MAGEVDPDAGAVLPASSGIAWLRSRRRIRLRFLIRRIEPKPTAKKTRVPITIPAISPPESGIELLGTALGASLDRLGAELSTMVVKDRVDLVEEGAAGELVGVAEIDVDGGFVNSAVATLGKMRLTSGTTRAQNPSAEAF